MLFACANNLAPDFKALARSTDAIGWEPALQFKNVTAPLPCEPGTLQRDRCQGLLWCGMKAQLGIVSNEIDCSNGGGPDAGNPDAGTTPPPRNGCGCATGGAGGGIAALGLLALGRRRRR